MHGTLEGMRDAIQMIPYQKEETTVNDVALATNHVGHDVAGAAESHAYSDAARCFRSPMVQPPESPIHYRCGCLPRDALHIHALTVGFASNRVSYKHPPNRSAVKQKRQSSSLTFGVLCRNRPNDSTSETLCRGTARRVWKCQAAPEVTMGDPSAFSVTRKARPGASDRNARQTVHAR